MSKTPITDAVEYADENYHPLAGSYPAQMIVRAEDMRALEIKYNEVEAKLEVYENDLQLAAGELMLPLPELGSDMARVCVVNRLLKYEIDKLNDKLVFANDILEEIKGAAHGRALLGGSQDEWLGTVLKVDSLAGQCLAGLNKNEK